MRYRVIFVLLAVMAQFCLVPAEAGKSDDKKAKRLIKDLKKSRVASERSEAAWDLGELGVVAAVPALTEALRDSSAAVRANAATSLGKLGDAAKTALPALRELLNDSSGSVVASAAWSLVKHGVAKTELIPAYRRVLEDKSCRVRLRGVRGLLGQVPPQELFPVALACSRDPDLETKMEAGDLLR
ncbi:HEAT repeat domain-containing protein, partial [candidate division CSSED10-310 bacterium]